MTLTQERAEGRSLVIKKGSISYDFHISLQKDLYHGYSEISFDLLSIHKDLTLDFSGKKWTRLVVNKE